MVTIGSVKMIGKIISHYKILEKIGEGGMGVVYKAEDTKLKRTVALKFLPPELTRDKDAKERFIHEAQAAAVLDHPNICNVYEIDETEDGQMFIAMGYYEGVTLKDKIKKGPLTIEEALKIAIQVSEGLHEAHEKGIVHRDIKSANIIITDKGIAKILDFGLAKLKGQSKLTKVGTTIGTAAYMSPEQAKGQDVDHRTDIWPLGVVLYEMVTGQLPFKGDYEQAVIYSIMNDIPEPITSLRTGIPIELEKIINKTLVKNPDGRYQHLDDMIVDLRNIKKKSENDVGINKEMTTGNRTSVSRLILPLIFIMTVVLIVAGIFLFKERKPDKILSGTANNAKVIKQVEWKNSIAVLPIVDLSPEKDQEHFCDGMTVQIISNLTKLQKLKVTARTSVMKFRKTEKSIPQIGKELKVAYILEGSLRKLGDQIRVTVKLINVKDGFHLWSEDYNKKYKKIFDVWDDISEKIGKALLQKLSIKETAANRSKRPGNLEAYNYYLKAEHIHLYKYSQYRNQKDFNTAEGLFKKAIELDPIYAPAYAGLADLYDTFSWAGTKNEAEKKKYLELSEKYTERAFILDPTSAQVIFTKGLVCFRKGDIDKQWEFYKKAWLINPNDANINRNIGLFFQGIGLSHLAIIFIDKAIELDPLYFRNISAKAFCTAFQLGEFDQAEKDYRKVLEFSPKDQEALYQYSLVLFLVKKYDAAKEMIEKHNKLYPDSEGSRFLKAIQFIVNGEKEKALDIKLDFFYKGYIYIFLKKKEESIQFIIKDAGNAKKVGRSYYIKYKNRLIFDFLRGDSRFQKILAEHKKLYEENLRKYGDLK